MVNNPQTKLIVKISDLIKILKLGHCVDLVYKGQIVAGITPVGKKTSLNDKVSYRFDPDLIQ